MQAKRRVVVTGLGVASPIGIGIEPFWDALMAGQVGIRRLEAFDPAGLPVQVAGELPSFKLGDYIPKSYRKSVKVMSRDIMIAVICAYHAVRDSGLRTRCLIERAEVQGPPNVDSTRFGANIGAGLVCADLPELAGALSTAAGETPDSFSLLRWGQEGMTNLTPLWLLKFLPNMLACHVTIVHDAQAPSNTVTCGEASSHLAIGEAFRTITRGSADVCICGGAESKINPMAITRPLLNGQLNTTANDHPQRACQPFGAQREGAVVSDGGGLVILESLEHARSRGARIYAELTGFGAGTNTHHWSEPEPQGRGIALALKNALADADTSTQEVDLAVPFGTGTPGYDSAEMVAWNHVFGDRLDEMAALTTRGAVGLSGAGTGAMDFSTAVLALYSNTVPPSANTDKLDRTCRFRFVQNHPIDAKITCAAVTSYALEGGQAVAVVVRKYEE